MTVHRTGRRPGTRNHAAAQVLQEPLAACAAVLFAILVAGAAAASPVVPLRDTTLETQGSFARGCAFVGNQLQCWGGNSSASLDIGATALESLTTWMKRPDTPSGDFDRPTSLVAIDRTCLTDAAGVWCWGRNERGQLGLGDRINRTQPEHLPGLPADVVEVVLGRFHACARTLASGLWCWGGNNYGETGQVPGVPVLDPITNVVMSPPQTLAMAVPGLPATPTAVSLGEYFSCALVDRRVWCWGNNEQGQLGDGSQVARSLPAPVTGLPAVIQRLELGEQHACAIDAAGDVWCWGNNQSAQVGVAASPTRLIEPLPLRVDGMGGPATDLHLEYSQSCALVGSDKKCWGVSIDGTNGPTPQLTAKPEGAPADWLDDCFLRDGELRCASTSTRHPYTPLDARPVPGLLGRPAQLALGRDFACARMPDESVWCWGINSRGQLGQGDLETRSQAVRVPLPPTLQIAVGTTHACAATSDGLWCWGSNATSELGDGTTTDRPAPVRSQFAGTLIAAGEGYTCAFASGSGGLRCWGRNDTGQVSGQVSEPLPGGAAPLGVAVIRELSAGLSHTCAVVPLLLGASETRCWGKLPTTANEIANGITDFSPRLITPGNPVPATALTTLRSSGFTTCAGDRCFGLSYLPTDRGVFRVDQLLQPPMPSPRAFALGSRLACVQGAGTDVQCSALTNRACQFEWLARLLLTPGQMIGCSFSESLISPAEREWIRVIGLPSSPLLLQGGEQYACAVLAEGTHCWGPRVPLYGLDGYSWGPVYRAGAIEPAPTVAVPLDPARACPAYLVASVSLLDPSAPASGGAWGQEILLGSGRRFLNGGLNFGGFGTTAGAGVPGYAAFSINNPASSEQAVTLDLRGDGGEFELTVESTLPPSIARIEVLRERVTLTDVPLRRAVNLRNGFHIVVLQPIAGTRLFLAGIGTTMPDGGPAAFQGGAVVGGYLDAELTGFSGICTDDAASVSIRTEARSSRGLVGASDLRLRLLEGQTGALLFDSASAQ
jgi:alpha-tubulin suppressor-like RCC1 family protein